MGASTHKKGFTFIEVLLVVGITVIISLVSILALSGWRRQYDLNTTAQKIATLLKEAQSKAMSQERGTTWGVYFNNSTSTTPYFALFSSSTYSTATQVEYFALPGSLVFNSSTLPLGATSSIVFRQISGEVDPAKSFKANGVPITSTFSINIFFGSNNPGNNQSSTIDITNIGRIRFVTLSCLVVCSQTTVVLTQPTLSLTAVPASIISGGSSGISWNAIDATSCNAQMPPTPKWTNSQQTSGFTSVSPSLTTTYSMTCTGSGGSIGKSVTVTVSGASDTTPPVVAIIDPPDGEIMGGNVNIRASASDNVGVEGVQLRVNGINTGTEDTSSPYVLSWNTNQVPDDLYNLTAVARDAAGNTTESAPITLIVDNTNNGGGSGGGGPIFPNR